jgi:hypothetical protein
VTICTGLNPGGSRSEVLICAAMQPTAMLANALRSERIHSGYLLSGAAGPIREAALRFARGLACHADPAGERPCEDCGACTRSRSAEDATPIKIDGKGKSGPLFRHIGDHPDLFWLERGRDDTRVRIGQIRGLQAALQLGANEGGYRVAVIADAEWLNPAAQNALLRLVEEPPPDTTILLVSSSASVLLPTIRSRCVRVAFPPQARTALRGEDADESVAEIVARLDALLGYGMPELIDWAEEYRGNRAAAAEQVETLLKVSAEWLRERVTESVQEPGHRVAPQLDAFRVLTQCRRDLVGRNANPQMVAERGLFAVREALTR